MRRFRIFLSRIMYFGHAAKRAAAAYPLMVDSNGANKFVANIISAAYRNG